MPMNAKDRLIFALDVPDAYGARKYVRLLGERVGMFKVGLELFVSEGPAIIESIADLTDGGIFLDLKFHDIPATVKGAIRTASRLPNVTFVTVHCDQGTRSLETIVKEVPQHIKVVAVTVLTSLGVGDLLDLGLRPELAENPMQLVLRKAAIAREAGCAGVVCSGLEVAAVKREFGDDLILITPGIRPDWKGVESHDQKRIVTPYRAIEGGADYIVVGRSIRTAPDPVEAATWIVGEIEQALQDRNQFG
jgi:orotidine-5'-phosphate decarboxylase